MFGSLLKFIPGSSQLMIIGATLVLAFSHIAVYNKGKAAEAKDQQKLLVDSTIEWQKSLEATAKEQEIKQRAAYTKFSKQKEILNDKVNELSSLNPYMVDTNCRPSREFLQQLEDLSTLTTKSKGKDTSTPK